MSSMAFTMLALGATMLLIVQSPTLAQTTRRSPGPPIATTKARTSGPTTRTTSPRTTGPPLTTTATRTLSPSITTTNARTSDSTPTTATTTTSGPPLTTTSPLTTPTDMTSDTTLTSTTEAASDVTPTSTISATSDTTLTSTTETTSDPTLTTTAATASLCFFNGTTLFAVAGQVGYLSFPNYPSAYYGVVDCWWTINSTNGYVKATILNATSEFSFYIELYDGMSGSSPLLAQISSMPSQTAYYSSGQSMYIRFSSNSLGPNSFFSLTYETVDQWSAPASGPTTATTTTTSDTSPASTTSATSDTTLTSTTETTSDPTLTTTAATASLCFFNGTTLFAVAGQVGYLSFPNYPSAYYGVIDCWWTINSTNGYVKATILNATSEFSFYIELYDGMSGSSPLLAQISSMPSQTAYYSSGQSMYIRFSSNGLGPSSFFSLTYETVDQWSAPASGPTTATTTMTSGTSPASTTSATSVGTTITTSAATPSMCSFNGTTLTAEVGQVGYLSSPYNLSVYSDFIDCSWTISCTSGFVIKTTVLNFTNSGFNYIGIHDGISVSSPSLAWIYSMPSQTVYYSSGQSMYIRLYTYGPSPPSFNLTYEAVDQWSSPRSVCFSSNGTSFSAEVGQVGYLTSLYFPSVFNGFIACSWTINSTGDYVVKATFLTVTNPGFYFYITIYDGMSQSSPSLGEVLSTSSQPVYYSSGQSMYIRLVTYGIGPNSSLSLTYEAVDQRSSPRSVCFLNGTSFSAEVGQVGYLTSLYYPSVYNGFIACSWTINSTGDFVVKATFLTVTNPGFYFYISIYDGMSDRSPSLGQISSTSSQPVYYSSGQSIYIRLVTYGIGPNSSLSLTYEAVAQRSSPRSVCFSSNGTSFSAEVGQVGYLTSLYYPSVYNGFIACSWTINSTGDYVVKATFLTVTNPGFSFSIAIHDGMSESSPSLAWIYSMPSQPMYYSSGQSMYIRLVTYGVGPDSSLNLTYEAVDQSSAPMPVCSVNGRTLNAVPGEVRYLTSPNYPYTYENNADCRWLINAGSGYVVKVSVTNFNLERCCDYLELYNGTQLSSQFLIIRMYTMPLQTVFYSTGQYMYIRFYSDGSVVYSGFSLTYEAIDQESISSSVCPVNGTTLSAFPGQVDYLSFPNHRPSYSNNTDCRWVINSTDGNVVKLTVLNASSDFFYYIQIFDGMSESSPTLVTFYGMPPQTDYYSSGQYMYIRFTGYGSVTNSGLRVTYEAVNQPSVPTCGPTTTTPPRASDPCNCTCSCVSTCSRP